jgi:hypothetical protein
MELAKESSEHAALEWETLREGYSRPFPAWPILAAPQRAA